MTARKTAGARTRKPIETDGPLLRVDMPWDRGAQKRINELLAAAGRMLVEMKGLAGRASYEQTVLAWDAAIGDLDEISSRASWEFNTSPVKPGRDRAEKTTELMAKLWSRLFTLRLPYDVLKEAHQRLGEGLSWERRTYLKDLLRAFEQSGVHLDDARKQRVNAIDAELAEIGTRFSKVLKDREVLLPITPEQTRPLESTSVRQEHGGPLYLVLRETTFLETMRAHPDSDFRRTVYEAYFRGTQDQGADLDRLRRLREERSKLIAGTSYSVLEAENEGFTVSEVREALADLLHWTQKRFVETMEDYKRLNGGASPHSYDLLYLEEHAPSEGLDPQILREYFSAERTVQVLLELSTQLYGLTFEPEEGDEKRRIQRFSVFGASRQRIGSLIFDLFPREGKYSHAACWTLRGRASHYPDRPAEMGLVCNFKEKSLPGGESPAKGLMWDDVNTTFHEYGHVLHGLLINAEPLGAHMVPRSLVEVPSQVFENWALDPGVLDRLARHYQTGKPLTGPLRNLLYRKQQRFAARAVRTQVLYALFDLEFHDRTDDDPRAIWDRLAASIFGEGFYPPDLPWYTRFGHIDGYGAKYWGYKFADLGKSQIYWYIVHRYPDLLNRQSGDRLIEELLRFGGLKKLNQVAADFTGIPLRGLPYVLETLLDYPTLRAKLSARRGESYTEALESVFKELGGAVEAARE